MLHTVEVGSFCGDLIAALSNMMTWLNSRGSQPVILQEAAGQGTAFRLRFSTEAEALAFVCAFGGRLVGERPSSRRTGIAGRGQPEDSGHQERSPTAQHRRP